MTPAQNVDPHYAGQPGSPDLVLQLEFSTLAELETALGAGGPLTHLADPGLFPSLNGWSASQEAMIARRYAVGEGRQLPDGHVAYLVTYEGPAADEQAWHAHYIDRHRVLLGKFPGLAGLEIYTPATVVSRLPFRMERSLQRNKTLFASTEAMRAAMQSDVRAELRADFNALPRFSGESHHFPFAATTLRSA